ncbi:MAG: hypothetical protein JWP14_2067 [Frankiales bacterium]|nr:hypothetical protein [Frankiales bacterium]
MASQRVRQFLGRDGTRLANGEAYRSLIVEMRDHAEELTELAYEFMADCERDSSGWLAALCGWLPLEDLNELAETARAHLLARPDCLTAPILVEHHQLRQPLNEAPRVLHLTFPSEVLAKWERGQPLRVDHPTWVARTPDSAVGVVGGAGSAPCSACGGVTERLLRLPSNVAPQGTITSRPSVEFLWCANCSVFAQEATFAAVDEVGTASMLPIELALEPGLPPVAQADPEMLVGFVDLGPEWRLQDWMWSNGVENLHRVGGPPTSIQHDSRPSCPRCSSPMYFAAQIAVEDFGFEGIAYLYWCDPCAISAVAGQQS